ncbi:MAG: LLM class F420-dependent oxidoreductase [Acidimicrobiia bacterium]
MSGVVIPYWLDRPVLEALAVARAADALGYQELWMGGLYHFDVFALAGSVVGVTSSVTPVLGPLAAAVRDPVSIARGVASVATLAGRPVRLALGASNPGMVERFHGRRFGSEPERMRRVVSEVRTQLETGRSPTGYRSALGPVESHISVAAFGPRMVAAADEVADRMVLNLVTPEQAALLAGSVTIPTVAWVVAAFEPGEATRRQVAGQVAHYLAAPGYTDMFIAAGFGNLVATAREGMPVAELAGRVPDELLASVALYGSRVDIAERLERYRSAGVDVAFVPSTAEDPAGERVLSVLRRLV